MKILALLCACLAVAGARPAPLYTQSPEDRIPGEYRVKLKGSVDVDEFYTTMNASAYENDVTYEITNTTYPPRGFMVLLPLDPDHLEWLLNLRGVKSVEEVAQISDGSTMGPYSTSRRITTDIYIPTTTTIMTTRRRTTIAQTWPTIPPIFQPQEKDVKLTGGGHNFQGYVQVYNDSRWRLICPDTWSRAASDLVCKKLGLQGKAMTDVSDKAYEKDDNPIDVNAVIGVGCNTTDTKWEECSFVQKECSADNAVKVECALPNYVGCFSDLDGDRALVGKVADDLDGLTIAACAASCREDGFAYAGVQAPETCLCGSAGENLDSKTKHSDDMCTEGCSGMALQACGRSGETAAVYDVSIGNCGGKIKAKEGVVASPGFPENYSTANPRICQWIIDVSENGDTLLDFTMLDLEPETQDEVAYSENNGETWNGYKQGQRPDRIISSADTLLIRFTIVRRNNGGDGVSQGFLASFSDATTCGEQDIVNGTLELEDDMEYRPGDKVKLTCDDGYLPNYRQLACRSTGRWYPVPKCEKGRSMMPSLVFTTTLLYMMVTFVGVLGILILSSIIAMVCIRSKKKSEGYKGISSGESGYQKGPDDLDEKDHKVDMQDQDGMQDDGMDMMHSNEQAIPLATAGVE